MDLWKNLLKHREFDAAVDHASVAQIVKAKTEPATTRIMRLLDRLSAHSFNLYYVKGRDIILSDYLSRHRQKDLDPSELIPISFCCLKAYRSFIADKIGEDIFCVKTRASAKADKPLDPNYKPEHQSKSKLPSVTGKSSPIKTIRKPILHTPARPTPRRLVTPKSVKIQSDTTNDLPDTEPDPTPMKTPVMVHGGAKPKTPRMDGTPLAPSIINPSHSQTQPLIPRRILSSTPLGENREEIDKRSELIRNIEERRRILEEKRKILMLKD